MKQVSNNVKLRDLFVLREFFLRTRSLVIPQKQHLLFCLRTGTQRTRIAEFVKHSGFQGILRTHSESQIE